MLDVYTVAGSGAKLTGGDLDHPAMYISLNELGSLVLDIDGDRLWMRLALRRESGDWRVTRAQWRRQRWN